MFAVLGAIRSRYEELWRNSMIDFEAGRDARKVIGAHLCAAAAAIYAAEVFREVERDVGISVLIPASNAIGIVLRHSLTKKPSLIGLELLLNNKV